LKNPIRFEPDGDPLNKVRTVSSCLFDAIGCNSARVRIPELKNSVILHTVVYLTQH